MGQAFYHGWINSDLSHVTIYDPLVTDIELRDGDVHITEPEDIPAADIYMFAVKPQMLRQVFEDCSEAFKVVPQEALIISIAAGIPASTFAALFGTKQPIIRTMPNTPALVQRGVTVGYANVRVSPEQKDLADALLSSVGDMYWIEKEDLMHTVTAVSGSGPAYAFLLAEVMGEVGKELGLPEDLSMLIARRTLIGSGALMDHDENIGAAELRANVTSPGGTTEAALSILMDEGELKDLMKRALENAVERSKQLGRG